MATSGNVVVGRLAGLEDPCRYIAGAQNLTSRNPRYVNHDIAVVRTQWYRYSNIGQRRLNRQRAQLVLVPKRRLGGQSETRLVETAR